MLLLGRSLEDPDCEPANEEDGRGLQWQFRPGHEEATHEPRGPWRWPRAGHDAIDEASGSALGRESLHERHCLAEPVQLAPAIGAADEVRVQR